MNKPESYNCVYMFYFGFEIGYLEELGTSILATFAWKMLVLQDVNDSNRSWQLLRAEIRSRAIQAKLVTFVGFWSQKPLKNTDVNANLIITLVGFKNPTSYMQVQFD